MNFFIDKTEDKLIKSLNMNSKRGIYKPDIIYGETSSPLSLVLVGSTGKVDNLIIAPEIKKAKLKN